MGIPARPAAAADAPAGRSADRLALTAGGWSMAYAVLLATSPGAPFGFPFGTGRGARVAAAVLVALCLGWAAAATLLARPDPGARGRRILRAVAWSAAALLLVVIPTNLVMQLAFAAVADRDGAIGHGLAVAGGVLWTALAVAYQRRTGPGCPRCGRTADAVVADGWVHPPPWVRRVGAVAVLVPLVGFVLPHWLWAAGVPFGTTEIGAIREVSGSLWVLGAVPAAGALLTLGLVRRWGQVFPRRVPVLGGRPVPRLLATVPALLVAALLAQYGVMLTGCSSATLLGLTDACYGAGSDYLVRNWAFTATYPVFLLWGASLGATAVGYHLMTRRRCPACSRR